MGLRPLSGLLHALCAFLSPLPCFRAMMRKILPICYLFDSPRPGFALHRPLFALHPNIFPFIAGILCNLHLRRKEKYEILMLAFFNSIY